MATPDDAVRARTSLLTPVGRGAVAVIAAEGDAALTAIEAHFRAANGLRLRDQPLNRVLFGHWTSLEQTGGEHREEVVVCRTEAIRVEVHCHGGLAAGERILNALDRRGSQVEPWINWVRSDAARELDAECEIALASAVTLRTAAILLDQRHGALRAEIEAALNELARKNDDGVAAARRLIDALLDRAALGLRLTRPWQAAIAGRPNVGKSCLINALVGYQRAIVFDQPGTTRDVLAADTAIDGWPVRLSDSAGLRAVNDPLEGAGVALAKEQLARADLIVWVLDATALDAAARNDPATTARREMEREIGQLSSAPTLVVVNKSDLATLAPSGDCVVTSAVTGAGLESLLAAIAGRLVPRTPDAGAAVPFTARQATLLLSARNAIAAGDVTLASHELSRVIISNGPASPR